MASATREEEKKERKSDMTIDTDKPSFNMEELRELADLIEERGFTDFEFENEKIRVRMSKVVTQQIVQPAVAASAETPPLVKPEVSSSETMSEQEVDSDDGLHKITSPIVGTFYSSPSPDKDAFVKVGDTVSSESIVCIVEAMKLMNEIQAETSGEVVKIYVENAQPVEYGQPLFGIKK